MRDSGPMAFANGSAPDAPSGFLDRRLACLVTGFGFGIHGIEPWQRRAGFDFAHNPAFHTLLLQAFGGYGFDQGLRDEHCAVVVGNDDITWKNSDATATNRQAPIDERQAGNGCRRRGSLAPDRQLCAENACAPACTSAVSRP